MSSVVQDSWIADTKGRLNERQIPHDVGDAESLIKNHQELRDEINANSDRLVSSSA